MLRRKPAAIRGRLCYELAPSGPTHTQTIYCVYYYLHIDFLINSSLQKLKPTLFFFFLPKCHNPFFLTPYLPSRRSPRSSGSCPTLPPPPHTPLLGKACRSSLGSWTAWLPMKFQSSRKLAPCKIPIGGKQHFQKIRRQFSKKGKLLVRPGSGPCLSFTPRTWC